METSPSEAAATLASEEPRGGGDAMCHLQAERVIARSPTAVYAFLADLDNHKLLANRRLAVTHLDTEIGHGAIQLNGPLGISRTAHTIITERRPVSCWGGTAQLETGTCADVRWRIKPHPNGTLVGVTVNVRRPTITDRTLLRLGGRQWIRRRLHETLDRLATTLGYARAAERQTSPAPEPTPQAIPVARSRRRRAPRCR